MTIEYRWTTQTYKPCADIKTSLNSKFSEIRRDHPSKAFPPRIWPPKGSVDTLVTKLAGLNLSLKCEFPRILPFRKTDASFCSASGSDPRVLKDTTEFEENVYPICHLQILERHRVALENASLTFKAESPAWKTLTTILPRAGPLPALSPLLQHRVFTEPRHVSFSERSEGM